MRKDFVLADQGGRRHLRHHETGVEASFGRKKRWGPSFSAGLTSRSIRRSEIPARALKAIARKSRAKATGSPWKFPPERTAVAVCSAGRAWTAVPTGFAPVNTRGLSTAEFASVSKTSRQ